VGQRPEFCREEIGLETVGESDQNGIPEPLRRVE
jgi:hypothetical protein